MLDLEKLIKDLDELETLFCKNYSCGHFDCPCCINECYGDQCAIETLQEAIREIKEKLKQ